MNLRTRKLPSSYAEEDDDKYSEDELPFTPQRTSKRKKQTNPEKRKRSPVSTDIDDKEWVPSRTDEYGDDDEDRIQARYVAKRVRLEKGARKDAVGLEDRILPQSVANLAHAVGNDNDDDSEDDIPLSQRRTTSRRQRKRLSVAADESDDEDVHGEERAPESFDCGGECVIEDGHAENEGRTSKVVSTDPFDLPDEIVVQIFITGTSLLLAEQVSKKWRNKIESTTEFWKNACSRLSVHEGNITQVLRNRLKAKKRASKYHNKAPVWRDIWLKYSKKVCQHCFSLKGSIYPLFNDIVLCTSCKRLEPYNALTKTLARKYFKIHTQKTQRIMHEKGVRLRSWTYDSPMGYEITLYRFTQLLEMARIVHGEKFAKSAADKYRRHHRPKKMEGVHLREL